MVERKEAGDGACREAPGARCTALIVVTGEQDCVVSSFAMQEVEIGWTSLMTLS